MAYRAIIRFSFDGDNGSKLRNPIVTKLETLGFYRIGTATWNHDALPAPDVPKFASIVNEIMAVSSKNPSVKLDHIWSYVDIPEKKEGSDD